MILLRDLFEFTRAGFAICLIKAVNREFNSPDGCHLTLRSDRVPELPSPKLPGSKSAALKKMLEGK